MKILLPYIDLFLLGDFGSIVGQMCTCYGYTFTDSQLMVKVFYDNDPSKNVGKIKLTDDPADICEFLGK